MSSPANCNPSCCSTDVTTQIPGPQGDAGAAGAAGANAFTLTTSGFVIPAIAADVTVAVANNSFMAVGEPLFVSDGTNVGSFQVISLTGTTTASLKFMGYTGDSAPGVTIASGAKVTPSGFQGTSPSTPISIANGGTAAATKAAAQTSLGLGQDAVISSATGLAQVITNSAAQVGAIDITIPALGSWLCIAHVSIDWVGVTFGASRAITIIIRNITQGTTIATATRNTQAVTTTSFPTIDYHLPFVLDTSAAVNDHLQIQISAANNPPNSAGTFEVIAGSLCAVPLRKS